MSGGLPPPPTRAASGDFQWIAWYNALYALLNTTGSVAWSLVNKAGSSIADLANKNHNLLTSMQGGTTNEYYHLTSAQSSNLLGIISAPVTKTGNFTVGASESNLICNGTGSITVTLPTASSNTGRRLVIKTIAAFTVISASSNVVPLASAAAGTAILAATAGKYATLISDGTNWVTMTAN